MTVSATMVGSYGERLFRQMGPAYKDAADSFPLASPKASHGAL